MKPNDLHPTTRPSMSVDTNVLQPTAKTGRRSTNTFWLWLILILAFLYLISPIDFIPDVIPVLGWIDDVVVALSAILIAVPKLIKSKS